MKYKLIKKQGSIAGLLLTIILLFLVIAVKAQTYVTGGQMTGTPTAGSYYNNSSITLTTPFSFAAATGSSLNLFITAPDCVPLNANPSTAQNYIITSTPRIGGIISPAGLTNRSTCDLMQTVQYFDGLGRPIQTVQVKGSFADNDIVQPMIYDQYGRDNIKYLPYALSTETSDGSYKANALTAGYGVLAFYNPAGTPAVQPQLAGGIPHVTTPYAVTIYEPSPLNRVTEQGAPGDTWQPNLTNADLSHTSRIAYATNDNTDITNIAATFKVMLYKVNIGTDGTRTLANAGTNAYANGQLYVTIGKDENWQSGDLRTGTTQSFKDKAGNVILKRVFNKKPDGSTEMLSTYYVYDDYGNLGFVLPPGALPDGGAVSSTSLDFWCYQYRYDERGRLIEKKLPGKKGKEFTVYNSLNQVVMTQDANQRSVANQQWTVAKYDAQGRVVVTGLYTDAGSAAATEKRTNMQAAVAGNTNLWEVNVTGGNGYNTAAGVYLAYPTTLNTTLGVNYYDNYNIPALPATFDKRAEAGMSAMTNGLPTASLVKVLDGTTGSNNMLWSVNYYDAFGRNTRGFAEHFKGGLVSINNYDEVKNTYDFTGALLTNNRVNYINSSSNTLTQSVAVNLLYEYDHMGRKLRTWQSINGNAIMLNSNIYNETGQLIDKKLHSADNGQTFVQSVDYRYNSRGWLKSINNAALNNADPLINNDTNDAFGEEISYDDYGTAALKQYNGNISAVNWQGKKQPFGTAPQIAQSYEYSYDKLNRLTLANYTTAGFAGRYNEAITYDAMGNIKKLSRYRDISNAATPIDQLTYVYDNSDNSNTLLSVTDVSGSDIGQLNGTANYVNDANGNLQSDSKKQLGFTYNYLNLPYIITKTGTGAGTITYIYDATGRKLRKVMTGNNRDYVNGIEYDNSGTIVFIQTEDGRATPNGSSYFYDYALEDHLGNTRVLVGQDGAIAQQTDYYAFGMEMSRGVSVTPNPDYKYKYNGKELQDELGMNLYDYGARLYDPVTARWEHIDKKAELYYATSSYVYALNQPTNAIDPNGKLVVFINGNHFGGAGQEYWNAKDYYKTTGPIGGSTPNGYHFLSGSAGGITYGKDRSFDGEVMAKLGDNKAIYYDGSGGGWHPLGDFARESATALGRWEEGEDKGYAEASRIIASLARDKNNTITESIKFITHSMGGAYGNGFIAGLQRYIQKLPLEVQRQIKIALVADFDPFQAGMFHANPDVKTQQFKHQNGWNILGMGWLANEDEDGAEQVPVNANDNSDHSIFSFFDDISKLEVGTYTWDEKNKKWVKQ